MRRAGRSRRRRCAAAWDRTRGSPRSLPPACRRPPSRCSTASAIWCISRRRPASTTSSSPSWPRSRAGSVTQAVVVQFTPKSAEGWRTWRSVARGPRRTRALVRSAAFGQSTEGPATIWMPNPKGSPTMPVKWLKGILENSAASRGVYTFKDRVKPWYEIRDKVLGKRNHENADLRKPDYRVRDVTDASGFRIVCLFNAEIPSALEKLFALLKAPAASTGRFAAKPIREILFFSSRRAGDPLSVLSQIEAVVDQHEHSAHFKVPSAVDEEGHTSSYSSVHVIVESEVGDGTNCVRSCSEIQLRSVFEEAWGEINHRLKYAPAKRERALGTQGPSEDKAPSQLFLHLDALKSLTDGCAQYADLINTQILQSRPGEASRKPRSIDPVGMALEPFEACEASVKQLVSNALKLRQKAEDCPTGDKKGAAFVAASQAFGRAAAALAKSKRPAEREWLLELLTEERAYCEMFSGNAELLKRAEMTYRDLLRTKHSPSPLLRLGQIRLHANDF